MDYTICRRLSPESSQQFMELQAHVSRIVGTHRGTSFRPNSLSYEGVNLVPVRVVKSTLNKLGVSTGLFVALMKGELPESTQEPLTVEATDSYLSETRHGNALYVGIGSTVLRRETNILIAGFRMLGMPTRDLDMYDHGVRIGQNIDEDRIDEVLKFTDEYLGLNKGPQAVSLEPLSIVGRTYTQPIDIYRQAG